MNMTAEEREKLERFDAALRQCTDLLGLRTPLRQVRLFCALMARPIPPRTVQEMSDDVGAPVTTVWTDMQRLGHTDRHGAPGLDVVTEISNRIATRTTFVINARGYSAGQMIATCL